MLFKKIFLYIVRISIMVGAVFGTLFLTWLMSLATGANNPTHKEIETAFFIFSVASISNSIFLFALTIVSIKEFIKYERGSDYNFGGIIDSVDSAFGILIADWVEEVTKHNKSY